MDTKATAAPGYIIAEFEMQPVGSYSRKIYGVFTDDSTLVEVREWARGKWDEYRFNRPTRGRLSLIQDAVIEVDKD